MSLVNYASNPRVTMTYSVRPLGYVGIRYQGNTVATSGNIISTSSSGSYTSPDLSFNTKYTFTLTPYNSGNVAGMSQSLIMDTTPNIAGVYVGNNASTSANATLKWVGTYNYVKINRAYAIGMNQINMIGNIDISTNVTGSSYIDTDMCGNTTYQYTITPYVGGVAYTASTPITVSTNSQVAGNLYAGFVDSSSIQVYFTLPKNSYTGYVSYNLRDTGNTYVVSGSSSPLQLINLTGGTFYNLVVDTSMNNGGIYLTSNTITLNTKTFLGTVIITAIPINTSNNTYSILTSNSFDISSGKFPYSYINGHYDLSCSSSANRPGDGFQAYRAANNYNGSYFWASAYANNGNQGYTLSPYKSDGTYQGGGLASNTYNTIIGGVSISGEWVQYKLPYLLNITSYKIQFNASNRITSNYYIAGSNDGNTWDLIDVSSGNSAQNVSKTVSISSTYTYYRLVINKQYTGSDGIAGINYWNIYGYVQKFTSQLLDIDSKLIIWVKGYPGDINYSTGNVANYSFNTGNVSSLSTGIRANGYGSDISNTQYKFGTSSLYNNSSYSGISCSINLPTRNWCFSVWWNPDTYYITGRTIQVLFAVGPTVDYGVWNAGNPPPKNPTIFNWVGGSQSGSPELIYDFSLNKWYHVVINTNENTTSWYVNNVFCISGNNPFYNIQNYSNKVLQLTGQGAGSNQYVPGFFADIRFYERALTVADISNLYYYTSSNY